MLKCLFACVFAFYGGSVSATTFSAVSNYTKSPVSITTTSSKLVLSERVIWGSANASALSRTGLTFQSDIYPTSMFAGTNLEAASFTAVNQYTIRIVPSALVSNATAPFGYSSGSIVFVKDYGVTASFTDPRRVQFNFDLLSLQNIATATLFTIDVYASGPSLAGRNLRGWTDTVGVTGTTTLTGQSTAGQTGLNFGLRSAQLQPALLVPEPSMFALFGLGLTAACLARRARPIT